MSGLGEPITWSISSGALPAGLLLVEDLISGIPTTGGRSTFTVSVTGISSATGDPVSVVRSFTIKVMEITTASALPNGDVDDPYSQALAATGYTGTPVWSVVSGDLPDGVTLHPVTGVLSGTPTEGGNFAFVIGIEDSDAHFCTKAFTLEIEEVALSPIAWWTMEEAAGDRVERATPWQIRTAGDAARATRHVLCRASAEREQKDSPRIGAIDHQLRETMRQRGRLTRACSGDDEQGLVAPMHDRCALRRIERRVGIDWLARHLHI